jgi:predicted O-methyltransferase YrrM
MGFWIEVNWVDRDNEEIRGGLSPREEAFCQAYVCDIKRNGTQAAIDAGLTENRKSAAEMASQLLRKIEVKARIRELEREALEAVGIKSPEMAAAVMREYMRIAFSDITDVIHISPSPDDPERGAVLAELARMNGGQRVIDFGETLIVPTANLPSGVTSAIKNISVKYHAKTGAAEGIDISMHDKLNALRVLAEANGMIKNQLALTDGDGGPIAMRWTTEDEGANDEPGAA